MLFTSDLHMLIVMFAELFILCADSPMTFPSRKIILTFVDLHFFQVT